MSAKQALRSKFGFTKRKSKINRREVSNWWHHQHQPVAQFPGLVTTRAPFSNTHSRAFAPGSVATTLFHSSFSFSLFLDNICNCCGRPQI